MTALSGSTYIDSTMRNLILTFLFAVLAIAAHAQKAHPVRDFYQFTQGLAVTTQSDTTGLLFLVGKAPEGFNQEYQSLTAIAAKADSTGFSLMVRPDHAQIGSLHPGESSNDAGIASATRWQHGHVINYGHLFGLSQLDTDEAAAMLSSIPTADRPGMCLFNTDSNKVQVYDGTEWRSLW